MQKETKKVLYSQIIKIIIMRKISSILFLMLFAFMSCTETHDNVVISKNFTNHEWGRFEYLKGSLDIKKAPQEYDIIMEIVVDDIYPNPYEAYQTECFLPFNLTIKNPDDNGKRSKDYRFMLKDKDGNWKAEEKNGLYTFKLPVIEEMTFSEKGTYNFVIENKYSKDPLYGIKSMTLKCIKSK